MRISLLNGIISLISFSSLALARTTGDCAEIYSLVGSKYVPNCEEDENGKVTLLEINTFLDQKIANRVFSYDSIKSLKYKHQNLENNKLFLEKLGNLEELDISIYKANEYKSLDYYSFNVHRGKFVKNGFKLPKAIEKLKIEGIDLTQEFIDEVTTLLNLKELEFKYCDYHYVNFEGFSNLVNLSTLTIDEKIADNYTGCIGNKILKNFSNIKKLVLNNVKLTLNHLKEISSLINLKELDLDEASQEQLKNVKSLFTFDTVMSTIKNMRGGLLKAPNGGFISKEDHFNRNIHQAGMAPVNIEQMRVYCELDLFTCWNNTGTHNLKDKDNFFTRLESWVGGKRGTNTDFRGVVGTAFEGCQFVYDKDGKIVVNSLNKGTYDTSSPQTLRGHVTHIFNDVLPWLLWGNGIADLAENQIMSPQNQVKVADIISRYKENIIDKETAKGEIEGIFSDN